MSTYVYMRLLESAPRRYDLGIRLLSLGHAARLYAATADAAVANLRSPHVLEIGCGTANLTECLIARGAVVTAIDCNPDMLEVARRKLAGAKPSVDFREMTAVEIADRFPAESFDAVASSLALSEMSEEEQRYVLEAARNVLRCNGRLVIADEVRPQRPLGRLRHACIRWPLAAVTWVLTQTSTSPVADPAGLVRSAGFHVLREERMAHDSMSVVVAEKRCDEAASLSQLRQNK